MLGVNLVVFLGSNHPYKVDRDSLLECVVLFEFEYISIKQKKNKPQFFFF